MRYERVRALNVLSHVDTEIKFSGYDAVVVVGPNGVGKSTLLVDVPLVACFGSGRSSDLDGYVRNGADWAQFEFDFSTDQGIFRSVRKRSKKTARGTTVLEFYQIDAEGNVIRTLTAGSIGETQSLIKKTLGMEFDTLVRASITNSNAVVTIDQLPLVISRNGSSTSTADLALSFHYSGSLCPTSSSATLLCCNYLQLNGSLPQQNGLFLSSLSHNFWRIIGYSFVWLFVDACPPTLPVAIRLQPIPTIPSCNQHGCCLNPQSRGSPKVSLPHIEWARFELPAFQ